MLVKQLADKGAWPYDGNAGKNKIGRQLYIQTFIGENFFITYPMMVQKYGQIFDKKASFLLLQNIQAVDWSEPSMDPLPDISIKQLMERLHILTLRISYKISSLIQLAVFYE